MKISENSPLIHSTVKLFQKLRYYLGLESVRKYRSRFIYLMMSQVSILHSAQWQITEYSIWSVYSGNYLEELSKNTKASQDSWFLGRDLKPDFPYIKDCYSLDCNVRLWHKIKNFSFPKVMKSWTFSNIPATMKFFNTFYGKSVYFR
jgi:hypothetical protein